MQPAWYAAMLPIAASTLATGGQIASQAVASAAEFTTALLSPDQTEPTNQAEAADADTGLQVFGMNDSDPAGLQLRSLVEDIKQALEYLGLPSDLPIAISEDASGQLQVSALEEDSTPWIESIQSVIDQRPEWKIAFQDAAAQLRQQSESPLVGNVSHSNPLLSASSRRENLTIQLYASSHSWSWA